MGEQLNFPHSQNNQISNINDYAPGMIQFINTPEKNYSLHEKFPPILGDIYEREMQNSGFNKLYDPNQSIYNIPIQKHKNADENINLTADVMLKYLYE